MTELARGLVVVVAICAVGGAVTAQVVINEIHYHPSSDLRDDEFIELHNGGASPVDLGGWSFADGVDFTFPPGTTIPARGYIVVARDAARVREAYGLAADQVIGDYDGALSNAGERLELTDRSGLEVDVVDYLDEYPWPPEADGDGPSLECLDPARPNDTPRNWLPSRNRDWVEVRAEGVASSNRFHLYLEGAGECLIDDLRITRAGSDINVFPEGDFESDDPGWSADGTHEQSGVTTDDAHSGDRSYLLVATGRGSSSRRSATRTLDGLEIGEEYVVSLWARPLTGNSGLVIRISGGGLLARNDVALLEGTPGRENSSSGLPLRPFISSYAVDPALPLPGRATTLLARVEDDDLTEVKGFYDLGDGPSEVILADDGLSGDGEAGDGLFGGPIPAAAAGAIVEYGVTARDATGNRVDTPPRRYPVAVFDVASDLPVYHLFIRPADWSRLNADIWTEEYFPAVLVHEGEVFSDVGLRFRGGRPRLFRKKSLKVRLSDRQLFEGRRRLNLNAAAMDDDYLTEPLAYWFYERAGLETSHTRFVRVQLNGEFWGLFIDVEQVDERYLERFGHDPDGALYKAVGIVGSHRKLDGVRYEGREYTYESQYEKKTREDEPYDDLIEFIHGLYDTPATEMEGYLDRNLDVEQYVNYLAASNVMCVWDHIQHNFYFYRDTEGTGKWRVFPWDLDHAWGEWEWNYYYADTYHFLMGTRTRPFANVWYTWNQLWTVLLRVPRYRQMYLDRIRELLNTHFVERPVFAKIEELRAEIESTVLLDEEKWPDHLEPQHTGPRRTMAEELPLLQRNFTQRREYMARVLRVTLMDDAAYLRGDANADGERNISDVLTVLDYLFAGGVSLSCPATGDANDDGRIDLTDAVALLNHLFAGGEELPEPFATCGPDATPDELGCEAYEPCE